MELLAALVRRIPAVSTPPVPLLRTVLLMIVMLREAADDVQSVADRIPDQIFANEAVDCRPVRGRGSYGAEPQGTHQLIAANQEVTARTGDENVFISSREGDEVVSEHQIAAAVEPQVDAGAQGPVRDHRTQRSRRSGSAPLVASFELVKATLVPVKPQTCSPRSVEPLAVNDRPVPARPLPKTWMIGDLSWGSGS